MFRIKIIKKNERIHYIIYRNYGRVDQLAKVYENNNKNTKIVVLNSFKFKKYILKKGLVLYNKKCLKK
jgi:hypothetical protein